MATFSAAPALAAPSHSNGNALGNVLTQIYSRLQSAYDGDETQREADIQKQADALREKQKTAKQKAEEAKADKDAAEKLKASYFGEKQPDDGKGDKRNGKKNNKKGDDKTDDSPAPPPHLGGPTFQRVNADDLCSFANLGSSVCQTSSGHHDVASNYIGDEGLGGDAGALFSQTYSYGNSNCFFGCQGYGGDQNGHGSSDDGNKNGHGSSGDDGNQGHGYTPPPYTPPPITIDWRYPGQGYDGHNNNKDNDGDDDGGDGSDDHGGQGGDDHGGKGGDGGGKGGDGGGLNGGDCGPPSHHSPVPEPATWAIMLVGFVGVGGAVRWRRRPAAA